MINKTKTEAENMLFGLYNYIRKNKQSIAHTTSGNANNDVWEFDYNGNKIKFLNSSPNDSNFTREWHSKAMFINDAEYDFGELKNRYLYAMINTLKSEKNPHECIVIDKDIVNNVYKDVKLNPEHYTITESGIVGEYKGKKMSMVYEMKDNNGVPYAHRSMLIDGKVVCQGSVLIKVERIVKSVKKVKDCRTLAEKFKKNIVK